MNILVIGNGFDLAHGLPTKYTDFLEFVSVSIKHKDSKANISRRLKLKHKIPITVCAGVCGDTQIKFYTLKHYGFIAVNHHLLI